MNSIRLISRKAFSVKPAPAVFSRSIGGPGGSEHGNDAKTLEKEKHKNLEGDQDHHSEPMPDHAPGWNQKLASSSEAGVKADRHDANADELQEHTAKKSQENHEDSR